MVLFSLSFRIMSQLAEMQRYYSDLGWLYRFSYPQPFQYVYPGPTVLPGVAEIQRLMAMYYTPGNLNDGTGYRYNANDSPSIPCPPVPNYDSTQISSHHSRYYGSPMDCIPKKDPTYFKDERALDLSNKVCRHERKYDKAGSNNGISINKTGKTSGDNIYTNSKTGKVCANSYQNVPIDFSCSKDVNPKCDSLYEDKGRLRQKAKHKPMCDSISQNGLKDMKYWSVDDVCFFLASVDGCANYTDVSEIDNTPLCLLK